MTESYIRIINEWEDLVNTVKDELENIDTVFLGSMTGYEAGYPQLRSLPTTKTIRRSFDDFKTAKTTADKDKHMSEILEYYDTIIAQTRTYQKRTRNAINKSLGKIQNRKENPIVHIRHFSHNKDLAMLMNVIATNCKGFTDIEELKEILPQFSERMEDMLNRSNQLWKNIIAFDKDTGKVVMNALDQKDIQTIADILPPYTEKRINELSQAKKDEKFVMLLAIKETNRRINELFKMKKQSNDRVLMDKRIQQWLDTQIHILSNRNIDEFEAYIRPEQAEKLKARGIRTAKEFLKEKYKMLVNTSIFEREKLINAKLGVATLTNYIPEEFEIDIIPYSVMGDYVEKTFMDAIAGLKRIFNNKNLKYKDILQHKHILISQEQTSYRILMYKIICFIRYFYVLNKTELIIPFDDLTKSWPWLHYLSLPEKLWLKSTYSNVDTKLSVTDSKEFIKKIESVKQETKGDLTPENIEKCFKDIIGSARISREGYNEILTKAISL